MKKIIPLLLILFVLKASAQDTIAYKPGILYKQGKSWRLDGRKLKPREIATEINTVPTAAAYSKKAKP